MFYLHTQCVRFRVWKELLCVLEFAGIAVSSVPQIGRISWSRVDCFSDYRFVSMEKYIHIRLVCVFFFVFCFVFFVASILFDLNIIRKNLQ